MEESILGLEKMFKKYWKLMMFGEESGIGYTVSCMVSMRLCQGIVVKLLCFKA